MDKGPFYKKPCVVGEIRFSSGQSVPFVKLNGTVGNTNSVNTLAATVLNELPQLEFIELLLSVSGGNKHTNGRHVFLSGLQDIFSKTCLTTTGIHEGTREPKWQMEKFSLKQFIDVIDQRRCAIGLVSWYRKKKSPKLEDLTREFGFDIEGDMFVLDANGIRWTLNPAENHISSSLNRPYIETLTNVSPHTRPSQLNVGDLVMMCVHHEDPKINLNWDDAEEFLNSIKGKIGVIQEICKNDAIRIIRPHPCDEAFSCSPKNIALVNSERLTDLLEKQFEKHVPANINCELVQAVKEKAHVRVINILSKTIMDDWYKDSVQDMTSPVSEQDMASPGKHDAITIKRFFDPHHDLFVIFEKSHLKHNESCMEFRDRLERKLVSEIIQRRQSEEMYKEQPTPVVKLCVPDRTAEEFENTNALSFQQGTDAETSDVMKFNVDIKNAAKDIAASGFDHIWLEFLKMKTEMMEITNTICKDYNNRNASRVIRHAIIEGRSDFFELLCGINSEFLKRFSLDLEDYDVLCRTVKKALSDQVHKAKHKHLSEEYLAFNRILNVLVDTPVRGKSSYRYSGFWYVKLRPIAMEYDTERFTFWDFMFLWSIILWKDESAHVIWRNVKNPVAMALIAYSVYNAVRRTSDDKVQAAQADTYMNKWSKLAGDTLYQCFQCNADISRSLLVMELPYWDNASCVEVAIHSGNKDVIRQQACQSLLDKIWTGGGSVVAYWYQRFFVTWIFLIIQCSPIQYACEPDWNLPSIKFMFNQIMDALFLITFACVLLFDLPATVSTSEYVLLLWVLTILAAETQQMASGLKTYFRNSWNVLNIGAVVVFFVGFGMRFKQFPSTFDAPRVVLAVDYVAFVFRLIQIFSVHKVLGPKIKMIKQMILDLLYFLMILAVFFLSYAVASHAVLYPTSPMTWGTVREVLRRPYWHLYGLLFLEETEGMNECSDNATQTIGALVRCPSETGKIVVPVMMGFYMMFVNILLLNMLIAMFSYSISEIHINAEKHWAYERYFLIKEYFSRKVFLPPLYVFSLVYMLIQCCRKKRNVFKADTINPFREVLRPEEATKVTRLETDTVRELILSQEDKIAAGIDKKIQVTHDKLIQVSERVNVFETKMLKEFKKIHKNYDVLHRKLVEITGK